MPIKTIKAPGYPDFKISNPVDPRREIREAWEELKKADQLVEFAGMRLSETSLALEMRRKAHGKFGDAEAKAVEIIDSLCRELSKIRESLSECDMTMPRIAARKL